MAVSIVTPWLDAPELIRIYERSHATPATEIIIVDNGSAPENAAAIDAMVTRNNGIYIRNDENRGFAAANNQGLAVATHDIILCLNNDTEGRPAWIEGVIRDVTQDGVLYGPNRRERVIAGSYIPYIEGHCIAATRLTWDALQGWDAEYYPGYYWEDNDLCWRAMQMGYELQETNWGLWHASNYTSSRTPGAYDRSEENRRLFEARVNRSKER